MLSPLSPNEGFQSYVVMFGIEFLSWILSGAFTQGQNVRCNETIRLAPNTQDSFDYMYRGPWTYTWCFSTNLDYRVTLNCPEVQMAKTSTRCRDRLQVTTAGLTNTYCNPFQEQGESIVLKLSSTNGSGTFRCHYKSEPANTCYCGYNGDSQTKITGGTPARAHEFTSMTALVDSQTRDVRCGATLIHERLAITAAHCVVNADRSTLDPNVYGLLVGVNRLSTAGRTESAALYRIEKFIPHPDFAFENFGDIAIIQTIITMWFDRNVGPACLPFKFSDPLYSETVIVAGWGHTEFGGSSSDDLLKGNVVIQRPSSCQNVPAYQGTYSPATMICTLGNGVDTCQHDSGGPVYYRDPATNLLFLLGVTATGVACGSTTPSISTRVFSYLDWIQRNYPAAQYCFIN